MPRNVQGLYTLPLPPVNPGELIESDWANTTMDDLASALTASLPRDGSAPMTGPLTLANAVPTNPLHATSKQYVDNFVAFSTGMPIGAVVALAAAAAPVGFLLCNGQAVSRATYAALFAAIGTTYGAGDGSTTFNVPDLRNYFVRGRPASGRALGSVQASAFGSHTHTLSDPGHSHTTTQAAHSHTVATTAHTHGVNDPGHIHSIAMSPISDSGGGTPPRMAAQGTTNTASALTGITLDSSAPTGTTNSLAPTITNAAALTGIVLGTTGDVESRPVNMALDYYIKALQDTSGPVPILGVTSSDSNIISIDLSVPTFPQLVIHSNVAFGTIKLDASGKVPVAQMPFSSVTLLGYFDASTGQNPSQKFPGTDYVNGNQYIVSVAGVIPVRSPVTGVEAPTLVTVGSFLVYIENSATSPDGWYSTPAPSTLPASSVTFIPVGTIAATDVQTAISELLGETVPLINNRILGDFSNATITNRDLFQSTVVNGATSVGAIPNGTSQSANFAVFNNSNPTNSSVGIFTIASTEVVIQSTATGSGTLLPLGFYTNGLQQITLGLTGIVNFVQPGMRIRGDMSTGTISNRLLFQTSSTNNITSVGIIPNGTSNTANIAVFSSSDPNNSSTASIVIDGSTARFGAGQTGSGVFLPVTIYTSNTEQVRIDTDGIIGVKQIPNAGWASSVAAVQLSTLSAWYQGGAGTSVLSNNIYNDGVGAKYIVTGTAGSVNITGPSTSINLYPSGTLDTALGTVLCVFNVQPSSAVFTASTVNGAAQLGVTNANAGNVATSQLFATSNAGTFAMSKYSTAAGAFSILSSTGGHAYLGPSDNFGVNLRSNNIDHFQCFNGFSLHINPNGSLGYGANLGVGGSITQLTNKSTNVSLNKACGQIIMNNASLAAGASVTFILLNTMIFANDYVGIHANTNGTNYRVEVANVISNQCLIRVTNLTAGALADALQLTFFVHRGSIN